MKRLLAAGVMLMLLVLLPFPPAARAEEDLIALTVETAQGTKGETLLLAMSVENPGGMDSLQFALNYDPKALSLIEVIPGEMTGSGILVYNTEVAGVVQVAFASALGLTEDGVFVSIRFRALTDAGSAVVLTDALTSRVDASYEQTKAYVSVKDGGVTVADAALPLGIVTPWPVETPVPTPTPTPSPTPTPTPFAVQSVEQDTPLPAQTPLPGKDAAASDSSAASLLIAAGAGLLVTAALIILLSRLEKKRRSAAQAAKRRPEKRK